MLTITTNIQSLISQRSLNNATLRLNQAIERMTTGYKLNHASDNAANYSISTNLTTKLGAYQVAEDNAAMALDFLSTASSSIDLINSHLTRIRDLAEISLNGTYGNASRETLQKEVSARLDEISRQISNTEYNNKKMFEPVSGTAVAALSADIEEVATENTTFEQLGIKDSSIELYNSDGSLNKKYTISKNKTIGDLLEILNNSGFNASLTDGTIMVQSSDGKYVSGALANKLGISVEESTVLNGKTSTSGVEIKSIENITTIIHATESTTFAELGFSGTCYATIKTVNTSSRTSSESRITIRTSDTISDFISKLNSKGISAVLNDGVLTLKSKSTTNQAYLESDEIKSKLGVQWKDTNKYFEKNTLLTSYTTKSSDGSLASYTKATSGDIALYKDGVLAETFYLDADDFTAFLDSIEPYRYTNSASMHDPWTGIFSSYIDLKDGYTLESVSGGTNFLDYATIDSYGSIHYTCIYNAHFVYTNTPSKTLGSETVETRTVNISNTTVLKNIENFTLGNGKFLVKQNGVATTISVSETDTIENVLNTLSGYGITGTVTNGKLTLNTSGDTTVENISGGVNLFDSLKMGEFNQNITVTRTNTPSKILISGQDIPSEPVLRPDNLQNYLFSVCFDVIAGNPLDSISLDFDFGIDYTIDVSTYESAQKALSSVDWIQNQISEIQVNIGSAQNRFYSVLDDISIQYENLLSSRSTLKDADIAKVSSQYIQQQILQQASATLMSTANQTPALALQLL